MRNTYMLLLAALLLNAAAATAQRTLYLDAQVGLHHGYAEEAYLRRSRLPAPLRGTAWDRTPAPNLLGAQARLELDPRWSVGVGVTAGYFPNWGFGLRVPAGITNNPYRGEQKGHYYSAAAVALPLTVYRAVWRANTAAVGAQGQTHAWGLGADVSAGLKPSYICGGLDFPEFNLRGLYDTIEFRHSPYIKRRLGLGLTLGTTLRLYRLDRERLNLTLQLTQGLWDTVVAPFAYYYNRRSGDARVHVRGSGIALTLGLPIRLKRYAPAAS